MTHPLLHQWKDQLIVSCQALEDEPLHSSFIMGRMALAAKIGGAAGIRANSYADIVEIKQHVALPVVGIRKNVYEDSDVFITPTEKEVKEIVDSGADMLALDATNRMRPNDEKIDTLMDTARGRNKEIALMADISTIEEALSAEEKGFDCVSTTLLGYTAATRNQAVADNDFAFLEKLHQNLSIPVVAEGKITTPEMARRALAKGAHCVVVGGAITRPQLITHSFYKAINKEI
ncbi:N-acetylmannosamine-6-phosphate 2-epimerase [Salibacterium aidingense]|uniref:N-acetylmannosamine-6-phosphate 2-epimerase n=1 Tax=Salibacterium aidingense TaxID=384933 RepID=UPI003BBDF9C8